MAQHCCGGGNDEKVLNDSMTVSSEMVTTFKVSGMDCNDEVIAIKNAFSMASVAKVDSNIMNETITIYHDKSLVYSDMKSIIEKTGLKVKSDLSSSFFKSHLQRILKLSLSGLALLIGLLFEWSNSPYLLVIKVLFFVSIISAGFIIFPKAWRSIKSFKFDMNVLMTVAVLGAIAINEFSEAASVVFLFSLAEFLESMSISRARKAIKDVLKVAPENAVLIDKDNTTHVVKAQSLKVNDLILVKPGEYIPVDGLIEEGNSSVNQASLTGESIAVSKKNGDTVWAGTINESGVLKIKVEKNFSDTKIAKVIALVEDAQNQKAPSERFVDKFASFYTPAVMMLAILVTILPPLLWSGNWEVWIYKALVLLVIGCPCALVIATPVSVVSGLTSLARRGVLVKGGVHLESLGRLKALALDKTGTVTNGTPEVAEIKIFTDYSEAQVLLISASLESMSTHPLAKAILQYSSEKKISHPHPDQFRVVAGKGAEGFIDGHHYFVGNHVMAHEFGICTPEVEQYLDAVENKAMSVVVLGHKPHEDCKGEILAVFAVGDQIRPTMKEAIHAFHRAGIKNITMLSGDNQKTVDSVAKAVGINSAKGSLLPDQKVEEIKNLISEYRYVGMIGDGVNDAPALAHATIGIAMGVAGSDTAIETADVALMKDDIMELSKAVVHGKRILRVIQFNIFLAILVKAVFFVLAFMGLANLWLAVASDMGVSLLVTFNALRLLKMNSK